MSDNKRTLVMDTGLDLNKDKHCDLDGYFVDKSGFHKPILRAIKTINQIKGVNQYNDLKMKDNFDVIGSFGPELLNAAYQYSLNQEFVANSSPMLNEYLRNNYPLNNVQKYAVKQLDLLIGKFKLNKQITIYRGISFSNPKYEEVLRLNIGDIYSNNGYTSASYDLRDASAYGFKSDTKISVFFEIQVPIGTHCLPLTKEEKTANGDECEILLPRNARLYIKNKRVSLYNGVTIIKYNAEVVNEN